MHVRVKGLKIFTDRHGKRRCYHRKTGIPINLQQYPLGSAEFLAECGRISALSASKPEPRPGTLGLLINEYRTSSQFAGLKPRTQRDYQRCLNYLQPIADTQLERFNGPLIIQLRDKAEQEHKQHFANYVKKVLSLVFSWGVQRGYLERNPAEGIRKLKRPSNMPEANRPWSDQERYTVLAEAPWHLRVPIALSMFCGLREGDVLKLPKSAYDGSNIEIATGKTGKRVSWPAPKELRLILDKAPKHDAITLAANSRGLPWTEDGYRSSWRKLKLKLEAEGKIAPRLTIHGLRHTVATILAEEGFNTRTIADALGQKTEAMARHYSKNADIRKNMEEVTRKLDESENKRRAKIVKP